MFVYCQAYRFPLGRKCQSICLCSVHSLACCPSTPFMPGDTGIWNRVPECRLSGRIESCGLFSCSGSGRPWRSRLSRYRRDCRIDVNSRNQIPVFSKKAPDNSNLTVAVLGVERFGYSQVVSVETPKSVGSEVLIGLPMRRSNFTIGHSLSNILRSISVRNDRGTVPRVPCAFQE